MTRILKRLETDLILSAIFEVRFASEVEGLAEILPGVLFSNLRDYYSKIEALPFSQLPPQVRNQLSDLKFQSQKQLVGKNCFLRIAERAVLVEVVEPYPGWSTFKEIILRILTVLNETGFIDKCDRASMRYGNLVPGQSGESDLHGLNVRFELADFPLRPEAKMLRGEIAREGCISIVTIQSGVQAERKIGGTRKAFKGSILDIDTIDFALPANFLADPGATLENIRAVEKAIFIELLNPSTLEGLGPEWEEEN